jgi:hypothetical protein
LDSEKDNFGLINKMESLEINSQKLKRKRKIKPKFFFKKKVKKSKMEAKANLINDSNCRTRTSEITTSMLLGIPNVSNNCWGSSIMQALSCTCGNIIQQIIQKLNSESNTINTAFEDFLNLTNNVHQNHQINKSEIRSLYGKLRKIWNSRSSFLLYNLTDLS